VAPGALIGVTGRPLDVLTSLGRRAAAMSGRVRRRGTAPPVARPGGRAAVIRGTALPADAGTYLVLPFEVVEGTTRVEVEYEWRARRPAIPENPLTQTVLDLGLWDEKGYRSADGFRGWSGSRARRVFVQADAAERGYRPGPVRPGVWHAELGLGAIGPTGADWTVTVRATSPTVGGAPVPRPVDRSHVANPAPGWYHGDFHMHAWHSDPDGPSPEQLVTFARAASLDFTPVTEYVVGHHWDEYGDVQEANPDLVVWPGREIVTYYGHAQSLGETPGFIEYRHGFEDVRIGDIQRAVRAAGALFQVNHPTTFAGPLFRNLCRGCAWELSDEIDWDSVDTMEVLTGPVLVDPRELGMPDVGAATVNPFFRPAVDLWESLLNRGHRITAVCGSDDKKGGGLGSCATAVYARELSRTALIEAIGAGHAYVRTRGVAASPALEMVATTADGQRGIFGDTLAAAGAEVTVTVAGGAGQVLRIVRNGEDLATVPVAGDRFTHTFAAERAAADGPLGTWYRVETFDARSRTTIGNPVFLDGR
jgi:hypothetical protein